MKILQFMISVCIAILSMEAHAQIRHVRGIKSADIYYLRSAFGSGGSIAYAKYFSNKVYGKGSIFFEQGKDSGLSYRSIGGELAVARNIFHAGHRYYFNGIGGCVISVDAVTKGGEEFSIGNEFKTGAFGGIENEVFISDRIVLILTWTQRILIRDAFGNYRWFAVGGFRFNL